MENKSHSHIVDERCPLDQDVISEILARLPAESLIQCERVCKSWFRMIHDPNFVHRSKQVFITSNFLLKMSHNFWINYFDIEDAYDGLIMLKKSIYNGNLCVYNHSTGQMSTIPHVPLTSSSSRNFYSLVYDVSIQKYKIVCFCLSKNMVKCYIYVMDSNDDEAPAWKELSFSFMLNFPIHPHHTQSHQNFDGVVCNGALNWVEKYETNRMQYVSSLDISSEKLRERIKLPSKPNMCNKERLNCKLIAFNGFLCYANPSSKDRFDFWVLRDWVKLKPIWIKQYTLSLSSMICNPKTLKSFIQDSFLPLAIYQNVNSCSVEIMILVRCKLFIYSVKSKELRAEEEVLLDSSSLPCFSKFTHLVPMIIPHTSIRR